MYSLATYLGLGLFWCTFISVIEFRVRDHNTVDWGAVQLDNNTKNVEPVKTLDLLKTNYNLEKSF